MDEILQKLVTPGGSTCRFFEGAPGTGKTPLTQLIEEAALRRTFAVARLDLSQALSLRDWTLVTRVILGSIVLEIDSDSFRGLPSILQRLSELRGINPDELETANLPHPGFRAAMMHALRPADLSDDASSLLSQFLLGERISATRLRRVGVRDVKNPLTARNSEQVLHTVFGGLHHIGLSGTVLLFDENDRTFDVGSATPNWVEISANKLRRLIDACFTGGLVGTAIVFTVLPGFLERCQLVYPALGERIRIVRSGPFPSSWRWPVLLVEAVNNIDSPEEFMGQAVELITGLVQGLSGDTDGIESELLKEGRLILRADASSGYRRALMKGLAASALTRL